MFLGESVDTPAIAPPANVKFALGDAVSTCDHFSLLTDDARAYRTHIPKASRGGETDLGSTKGRGGSAWAETAGTGRVVAIKPPGAHLWGARTLGYN